MNKLSEIQREELLCNLRSRSNKGIWAVGYGCYFVCNKLTKATRFWLNSHAWLLATGGAPRR